MDDEVVRLMKKHGTYLVPTISAGKWVGEKATEPTFFPKIVQPKAAVIGPKIQRSFAKAYAQGVNVVFGTDAGVQPHGTNAKEFVWMVEAGMSPIDAIPVRYDCGCGLFGYR